MRILLNALSARQGGGQTYVSNLLNFLPEQSTTEIFVLAPDSLLLPTERDNIKRIAVNWPVENPFVRAAWERLYLPRLARQLNADVLFCPGGIIGSSVPQGCKSVTTFQNMIVFDLERRRQYPLGYMRLRNWILNRVMRNSMAKADLVIFISEYARDVISKQIPGVSRKSVVIPNGVDPRFRAIQKSRPSWLPSGDYLLYVSILDYYKAQIEVVQAYALLRQKRVTVEKLILVGPEWPGYGRMVREEIERLNLKDDVLLAGAIPHAELPFLYQNARINIFASECENCPYILLEALSAGCPSLVSHRPPMPEFGGDAVVYFDPSEPEDLAVQLASLLDDEARLGDLAGRAKIRSLRYDSTTTVSSTWNAIRGLAN
jgi:glycosyltransferase involved in cell wall biosynthesis